MNNKQRDSSGKKKSMHANLMVVYPRDSKLETARLPCVY